MKRSSVVLWILSLTMLPALALAQSGYTPRPFTPVQEGYTAQAPSELPYAPDRVLVQFTEDAMENGVFPADIGYNMALPGNATGLTSFDEILDRLGATRVSKSFISPANTALADELGVERWYSLRIRPGQSVEKAVLAFQADPNVEVATPDWRAFPMAVPSDPLHADHWGHNNTGQLPGFDWGGTWEHTGPPVGVPGFDANAHAAWDQGYGSSGVIIAILDSGVDVGHPDLNQVAGYDYGDNDSNPDDDSAQPGHGTACAGVAASNENNGIGAAGAAPNSRIMPLKVANSAGQMYFSSIINAIYHAADNGADIISMSLGAAISSDPSTDAAMTYAYNQGLVILAATGNENASTISYPAVHALCIGVGAASPCDGRKRSSSSSSETNPGVNTDPNGYTCDGERWWGSNYGVNSADAAGAVDILAPTILPTTDIQGSGGYDAGNYSGFFNGTSCSTPYAAGVCALILAQNPGWTPAQVRNQLVNTAQDVVNVESGSGWDRYSGYGLVDAAAAVGGGTGPMPPTAAFTGSPTSGTVPLNVSFTDQSSNSPTSWSWTFGDGGTSSAQNPSHTYTSAGTYTVTLTASNGAGSDGETKTDYITVTNPGGGYASLPYSTGFESGSTDAYWSTNSTGDGRVLVTTANGPHGGSYHMTMDDASSGGYTTNSADLHLDLGGVSQATLEFWWKDFSDETHAQDGVYVSNNGGSTFTKVLDLPGGSYGTAWNEFSVDVDAAAASAGLSLNSTFVVRFQQYDNYSIATDGMAFDDISVTEDSAPDPPVADFSGSPTSGTVPLNVSFTDASTGAPTSWSWDFGDGGGSTAQNPSHTYTAAGTYTVTLTAANAGGSDAETKVDYITVSPGGGGTTVITADGFESGMGNYTDGGNDMRRYTRGTYAWTGSAAANIQDNSGVASSFYHTASYDVSGYSSLEVEFYFIAVSMENNEDFLVEYFDGSSWNIVASYARGVDFNNNTFYVTTVPISSASYNFPGNAKIRIRCDASGNRDDVYVDDIEFRGISGGAGSASADGPTLAEVKRPYRMAPLSETAELGPDTPVLLLQNAPNPFLSRTAISFALAEDGDVSLDVFDVRGRKVASLVNGPMPAGVHQVDFEAESLAPGVYFYRLVADGEVEKRKMILAGR